MDIGPGRLISPATAWFRVWVEVRPDALIVRDKRGQEVARFDRAEGEVTKIADRPERRIITRWSVPMGDETWVLEHWSGCGCGGSVSAAPTAEELALLP